MYVYICIYIYICIYLFVYLQYRATDTSNRVWGEYDGIIKERGYKGI